MKHPYEILKDNLSKYSKVLKIEDIQQHTPNHFLVNDKEFDILSFLNDVQKETGVAPAEHSYLTASCDISGACVKPYVVYGFDNVLFYFANKHY